MKGLKLILIFVLLILSSSFVLGLDTIKEIESFSDFNRNIDELNNYLQNDPVLLHPLIQRIVNNEDVAIHVSTEQGHIESFVISIYQNYLIKIIAGPQPTKLYIEIDEKIIDEIIQDPELGLVYYKEGVFKIKSINTVKKTKLFIFRTLTKWFG